MILILLVAPRTCVSFNFYIKYLLLHVEDGLASFNTLLRNRALVFNPIKQFNHIIIINLKNIFILCKLL